MIQTYFFPASGGDYFFIADFIPVPLGEGNEGSTKCFFVQIIDDDVTEPTESLTVFFTVNGRETSNATVTILDNDGGN